jgi:hypothetical protein
VGVRDGGGKEKLVAIEMLVPGVELLLKFLRDEGEPLHAAWSTEGLISLEDGLGQRDEITEHFEYLLRFGSAPRATPPEPPSLFARLLAIGAASQPSEHTSPARHPAQTPELSKPSPRSTSVARRSRQRVPRNGDRRICLTEGGDGTERLRRRDAP